MRELPLRIATMAAALLLAAVGFGATVVFLCLALYSALLNLLSAPLAALAAAGIVFFLSLLVIVLGSALSRALAGRARTKRGGFMFALSAELGKVLGEDASKFIAKRPVAALLIALAGGFAFSTSARLRRLLQALLKF
jgi:uncharacterized membrane protein YdfJ with MMPL/SSD domain